MIIPALGASAVLGYMLLNRKNKRQADKKSTLLEDAGMADQTEKIDATQLENSNMISEGSQYGVQYYNEVLEKDLNMRLDQ